MPFLGHDLLKKKNKTPQQLYLQGFEANMISDGAVLHVVLLIRMHVEEIHHLVGLNSAFQEEDKKSTRPANLQVIG